MKINTHYFESASTKLAEQVLDIVDAFLADHPDIEHVVVATTEGDTGALAAERFKDKHVVVVTHQTGFAAPNFNELKEENRARIERAGAEILTATHAFAGVARSFRKMLGTWTPTELMSVALRTFGQGTKVCAEIAMMAADAGLIPVDKDVITVGGTGRGADTAWLVAPVYTSEFPRLRMRACLCKPLDF